MLYICENIMMKSIILYNKYANFNLKNEKITPRILDITEARSANHYSKTNEKFVKICKKHFRL